MIANVFLKYPENFTFQQKFARETLQLSNLKTKTAMNSVFIISIEVIIYLLLYNLHGCTFKT